jgi:hypothetical protein
MSHINWSMYPPGFSSGYQSNNGFDEKMANITIVIIQKSIIHFCSQLTSEYKNSEIIYIMFFMLNTTLKFANVYFFILVMTIKNHKDTLLDNTTQDIFIPTYLY